MLLLNIGRKGVIPCCYSILVGGCDTILLLNIGKEGVIPCCYSIFVGRVYYHSINQYW